MLIATENVLLQQFTKTNNLGPYCFGWLDLKTFQIYLVFGLEIMFLF